MSPAQTASELSNLEIPFQQKPSKVQELTIAFKLGQFVMREL